MSRHRLFPRNRVNGFCFIALVLLGLASAHPALGEEDKNSDWLREGLVIGSVGRSGRSAFHTDLIEAAIVAGNWSRPAAGASVTLPDGTVRSWEGAVAETNGWFTNKALAGGYVYVPVYSDIGEVMLLEASGHNMVYVNGEPRTGDPYQYGYVHLPVSLRAGTNDFLFQVGRGRLQAKLVKPITPVMFNLRDATLPDVVAGDSAEAWAAVVVVNATTNVQRNLSILAACETDQPSVTALPAILPLSGRKIGFRLRPPSSARTNKIDLSLKLQAAGGNEVLDADALTLRVRRTTDTRKMTFRSDIDGSVQYFAVVPPSPLAPNRPAPALFLTVHGASVEALGQAEAYRSKVWGYIVAATNRRPYGFDWEDWGRRDAMEVLDLALQKFKTDPRQTYLTGHSMGGHGTWHIGATYPDRFAAIGPSAGWISFWSYGGARREKEPSAVQALLQRATNPGDTLLLSSNYLHFGIYILHGDADDNVPVTEARAMKEHLAPFHRDFLYHEQPGAGHWWGSACVDWPPMFDFFARHKIPEDTAIREINFTTANPGISSSSHWVSIEAQQHSLNKSSITIRYDSEKNRFTGRTENVARLALFSRLVVPGSTFSVELDGQTIDNLSATNDTSKIWFGRVRDRWERIEPPSLALKGPHRAGPFKEAFSHRMMFVFGTQGTPEENQWALAKARFDAEAFWYRGNGSVDVIADSEFDPARDKDRSVILYGNADSNAAWPTLLAKSPVQIRRDGVQVGDREERGGELACLFVRPRPGSNIASVAAIGGSGLAGMRLTDRVPYFLAGIAYPDCILFGPETLAKGSEEVLAAGFFGADWSIETGEFAWRN